MWRRSISTTGGRSDTAMISCIAVISKHRARRIRLVRSCVAHESLTRAAFEEFLLPRNRVLDEQCPSVPAIYGATVTHYRPRFSSTGSVRNDGLEEDRYTVCVAGR
jgi:hypothetical protein